ncbi:MAG TPA: trypsin-like peptidase domain-containing protein [Polyangiaceae bacterium]|nr:trypsin-like peptidase domain-containing protein [Polyangiaceae bacterium]
MSLDNTQRAALRRALSGLYPRETQQRAFVDEVGLRAPLIGFEASADGTWFNIIEEARRSAKLDEVLKKAREERPDDESLRLIEAKAPPKPLPAPELKGNMPWRGPPRAQALLEKIIGARSTLVPVTYLEVGLLRARAVARVRLPDSTGTGFLVANELLITNHHVLPDAATAAAATAQFNYQQTAAGLSAEPDERALKPDQFFATSEEDDWTAVRVEGEPTKAWGALALRPAKVAVNDPVNIIQHPEGGGKKLSFLANVVAFVGGGRVQYLTDTMPGSSGSPVFDHAWNLVALHHSGGWLPEPGSPGGEVFYRNQGIHIDVVIEGLKGAGAL